ncbi:hypothetical protein RND81_12G121300 [Saponaria officinalis]|uniref:Uncharacterized protein n=1 Tax=Saponaria officinalis TaxID=3572 RepID=A0AAW1H9L8_SAPOF
MLISLWMAQGYIVPFGDGQSIDDAAEECFLIMLRRCFFQDVKRDMYGEIVSCKIHDLMHDLAQDVAGREICEVSSSHTMSVDERVRHLSYVNENLIKSSRAIIQIRTCLWVGGKDNELLVGLILSNCVRLRSLSLSDLDIRVLPESIGKLLHLRYLDLSLNRMLEELPKSITKLHNLLVLKLSSCYELKKLPNDLSKLHKLWTLDISRCNKLKRLPTDMSKLAYLYTLTRYMIGGESMNVKECFDQLEDLKGLSNLKGSLKVQIQVPKNAKYVEEEHREGAYMRGKKHLNRIKLMSRTTKVWSMRKRCWKGCSRILISWG